MSDQPQYHCEICGTEMHPTEEHREIAASGVEFIDVSKLVPGARGGGWPDKPPIKFVGHVSSEFFAPALVSMDAKDKDRKLKDFKDQIVVDLGAGGGDAYLLAAANGAKGYIAVEPTMYKLLRKSLAATESDERDLPKTELEKKYQEAGIQLQKPPVAIAVRDMLSFLEELPDNSVSVITSGIDLAVTDKELAEAINSEIARVLDPKGMCLTFHSAVGHLENDETHKFKEQWVGSAKVVRKQE